MQRLLLFLIFMTLGTGLIYLAAVSDDPPAEIDLPPDLPVNQMRITGVVLEHLEAGEVSWRIRAREALFNEPAERTVLHDVNIEIFSNAGVPATTPDIWGSARQAILSGKSGEVQLLGDVVIHRGTGTVLISERVDYSHNERRIRAPREFEIRNGDTLQTGRALDYQLDKRTMTFRGPRFQQ